MADIIAPGATPNTSARPFTKGEATAGDTWFTTGPSCLESTPIMPEWLNMVTALLRQAVRTSGSLEATDDPRMVAEAMARYSSGGVFAVQTSSALNAYEVEPAGGFYGPTGYFHGMRLGFSPTTSNTGPATLKYANLPVKKILDITGSELAANAIATGHPFSGVYNINADSGNGAFIIDPWAVANFSPSGGGLTGTVHWLAASTAPEGYLECNGAEISRSVYGGLFSVIGTAFGVGDGAATFNIPDLRGEFIRGWDNGRGLDAGRTFGSSQSGQSNHLASASESDVNGTNSTPIFPSDGSWSPWIGRTGSGQGSAYRFRMHGRETRPQNIALLPIIKY